MPRLFAKVAVGVLTLCVTHAAGRVMLESYAERFGTIPIGVVAFTSTTAVQLLADQPWQVIADDFDFCPRTTAVRYLSNDTVPLSPDESAFFVSGHYTMDNDSISVTCVLSETMSRDTILVREYTATRSTLRKIAHSFANNVHTTLFGEPAPFESSILLVIDSGAVKNLAMMDYDGHGLRMITRTRTINLFPCFADKSTLVWVSYLKGKPDIFVADMSRVDPRPLIATRATETSPAVSLITGALAFASSMSGNMEIYVCDLDGQNRRQVTFNNAIDTSPCWSPDGYRIAFVSDRAGRPAVYVMDAEGGNIRRLTDSQAFQDSPAWSPRGDMIAYTALSDGTYTIWVVNADGKDPRKVGDIPGKNEYPTWAPDGSYIAFQSTLAGRTDVYAVRPDGSALRQLTTVGNAIMPDWSGF